jgi:hypothetical protein
MHKVNVRRAARVVVKGQDMRGKPMRISAQGLFAWALCIACKKRNQAAAPPLPGTGILSPTVYSFKASDDYGPVSTHLLLWLSHSFWTM